MSCVLCTKEMFTYKQTLVVTTRTREGYLAAFGIDTSGLLDIKHGIMECVSSTRNFNWPSSIHFLSENSTVMNYYA